MPASDAKYLAPASAAAAAGDGLSPAGLNEKLANGDALAAEIGTYWKFRAFFKIRIGNIGIKPSVVAAVACAGLPNEKPEAAGVVVTAGLAPASARFPKPENNQD